MTLFSALPIVCDHLTLEENTSIALDKQYAYLALTGPRKKPGSDFTAVFVVFPFDKLLIVLLGQSVCVVGDRPEIGIEAWLSAIRTIRA